MKTFLWYDIETFGLNPKYDRLAQFAAIRTDMDMNVIEEPVLLYARLSPDYLPSPESCLITGITPQEANSKGMPEAELIARVRDLFMVPDTIVVGYNSVSFDDEVIRNMLYRNLYDPYEREYGAGRSRWDIINLVRATRDLRPQGMDFSITNPETGAPSFRLTDLTAENHIDQVGAHDALVDVWATIAIAKLIKEKQPNLFSWALSMRSKAEIRNFINASHSAPFLHTASMFVSEKGNTHPVLPIAIDPLESNALYCFDLTRDIPQSPECSYQDTGIFRLAINRIPFIAPMSVLDSASEQALATGCEFLRMVAPFYFVICLKIMADGVFRGAGAMKIFMFSTFSDLLLRVALAYILSPSMGATGIWTSWPIGWSLATVFSVFCYLKGVWKPKRSLV